MPTSSTSRPTRTARARRSPGTWCRCSKPKVPVRRMVFHEITTHAIAAAAESHATSTSASSTRRRRAASSTGSTATRSHRSCGRRSPPGCRRVGCSRWRPDSWSSASASAWRSSSADYWDIAGVFDPQRFTATLVGVDGRRVARGSDFDDRAQLKKSDRGRARRGRRHAPGRVTGRGRPLRPLGGGEAVPQVTGCALHHVDAPAGGQPQAADVCPDRHAGGTTPVRERPHHLHAHRLDDAVCDGDLSRQGAGHRAVRRGPRQ